MQILLKNKRNEFTSILKLFPIQMCFEMFRKEKNQKGWSFKSVEDDGEIKVGNDLILGSWCLLGGDDCKTEAGLRGTSDPTEVLLEVPVRKKRRGYA